MLCCCVHRCSAGIACSKLLSKLVSGLHKPDDQTTILPTQAQVIHHTKPPHFSTGCSKCCRLPGRNLLLLDVTSLSPSCTAQCRASCRMLACATAHNTNSRTLLHRLSPPPDLSLCLQDFVGPLPVRALPGVGYKAEGLLKLWGVSTAADARHISKQQLIQGLGEKHGG